MCNLIHIVVFYSQCEFYTQCVILHTVYHFTHSVKFFSQCVILHTVCNLTKYQVLLWAVSTIFRVPKLAKMVKLHHHQLAHKTARLCSRTTIRPGLLKTLRFLRKSSPQHCKIRLGQNQLLRAAAAWPRGRHIFRTFELYQKAISNPVPYNTTISHPQYKNTINS